MHQLLLGLAVDPWLPPHLLDRLLAYEDDCRAPTTCDLAPALGERAGLSREREVRPIPAHQDSAGVAVHAANALTAADPALPVGETARLLPAAGLRPPNRRIATPCGWVPHHPSNAPPCA
ncbi:hypothetical protein ABZ401_09545 [Streptomyces sp. NPDC005892]|uniref:hypothetical protein n=1 Tax=Streptomyces sp. NPDC005892 TaxID=3155593 RepID=UPI0033C10586